MWDSLSGTFNAAAAAASAASSAASSYARSIEADFQAEYAATTGSMTMADALAGGRVGLALLNPMDDASSLRATPADRVVMLPWEAPDLSELVRARMRSASSERSIFLAPPTGGNASFCFDLSASVSLINEALANDARLEEQRHLLVPSQVSEAAFFTNYFHHLHVLSASSDASLSGASCTADAALRGAAPAPLVIPPPHDGRSGASLSSSSPVLVSAAASSASNLDTHADGDESDALAQQPPRTPIEDQFDAYADKLASPEAIATATRGGLAAAVSARLEARAEAEAPLGTPASQEAARSWEEELRAELGD